ncbi:MAG: rod shape-determining protein MreD [Oligoflexia bacterium]|nr:rod shape-determining protein MreD [Oligoflexia bacterium]
MRRLLLIMFLGLMGLLIQSTLIRGLFPHIVVPNLLMVMCVFLAFYETSVAGACTAFVLGLLLDMCGGIVLGPWAGSFVLVFGAVAFVSQRIFVESPVAIMVTTFVCSIVANIVYSSLAYQVSRSEFSSPEIIALEAVLNALLCPLLFALLRKLLKRRDRQGGGKRYHFART